MVIFNWKFVSPTLKQLLHILRNIQHLPHLRLPPTIARKVLIREREREKNLFICASSWSLPPSTEVSPGLTWSHCTMIQFRRMDDSWRATIARFHAGNALRFERDTRPLPSPGRLSTPSRVSSARFPWRSPLFSVGIRRRVPLRLIVVLVRCAAEATVISFKLW